MAYLYPTTGVQIMCRLSLTFLFCILSSFAIGMYGKARHLELQAEQNNAELSEQFTDIYQTLAQISDRYHVIADTHLRTQHYVKPHTEYEDLCPECGDLRGIKKDDIAFVPIDRLDELRQIERAANGKPALVLTGEEEEEEEVIVDVPYELSSIQVLLKSHKAFTYTLLQAETYTNHYAAKHPQEVPGLKSFGDCPECIALHERQTTVTHPIPKKRYDDLLQIEREFKVLE